MEAPDGTSWQTGVYELPAMAKKVEGPGDTVLNVNMLVPSGMYYYAYRKPVRVSGSLYMTAFGRPKSKTIAVSPRPTVVGDGLDCAVGIFEQFTCGSAFRWPNRLVYAQFERRGGVSFTRSIPYSPFPAGLDEQMLIRRCDVHALRI